MNDEIKQTGNDFEVVKPHGYKVGDKIKFAEEKQRYTVMACDARWLICVKPFNLRKTFMYTIVDLVNKIRGADNFYCRHHYNDVVDATLALDELNSPVCGDTASRAPYTNHELEISSRNRIALNIETK